MGRIGQVRTGIAGLEYKSSLSWSVEKVEIDYEEGQGVRSSRVTMCVRSSTAPTRCRGAPPLEPPLRASDTSNRELTSPPTPSPRRVERGISATHPLFQSSARFIPFKHGVEVGFHLVVGEVDDPDSVLYEKFVPG